MHTAKKYEIGLIICILTEIQNVGGLQQKLGGQGGKLRCVHFISTADP